MPRPSPLRSCPLPETGRGGVFDTQILGDEVAAHGFHLALVDGLYSQGGAPKFRGIEVSLCSLPFRVLRLLGRAPPLSCAPRYARYFRVLFRFFTLGGLPSMGAGEPFLAARNTVATVGVMLRDPCDARGFMAGQGPRPHNGTLAIQAETSMNLQTPISMIVLGLSCSTMGAAQEQPGRRPGPPHPEVTVDWSVLEQRIAWFGTMAAAKAAAQKTGWPILLVSGQPSCRTVPGVW